MKDAILRSGYLVERHVELLLEDHGYYVQTSPAYPDLYTGKSRELDIQALSAWEVAGEEEFIWSVILCECINNPQPMLFFPRHTFSATTSEADDVKLSGLPTQILDRDGEEEYGIALTEFLRFQEFHHYAEVPIATQYCSFTKKRNSSEWVAQHPDDYHDIFATLIRATEVEIDHHYGGWEVTEDEPINLQVYYPLLVVQGELFTAVDTDGSIALEQADHVQFSLEHFSTRHHAAYRVDVITEPYLHNYLELIDREMKRVAYRLYRNGRRVRESIDWLVGKARAEGTGAAIRTIFDFDTPGPSGGSSSGADANHQDSDL